MTSNFFILRLTADDEMKLRIVHGVVPGIDEATVESICNNAGISRRTFYNHFPSKYDLNPWYKRFVSDNTVAKIGLDYSWEEGFRRFFSLTSEEKEPIMRNTSPHLNGDPASFEAAIESLNWRKSRIQQLNDSLEKRGYNPEEKAMAYCVDMYTKIESHATRSWLVDPVDGDPELHAQYLASCVPRLLYKALSMS
ncbi:MAG: TetR/AcrR family transcriptional regulator [Raoultibacter sp.]|jgi:AcrR family transcriptional regulator